MWQKITVDRGWPETWERHVNGWWLVVEKTKNGEYVCGCDMRRGYVDGIVRSLRWPTLERAQQVAEGLARRIHDTAWQHERSQSFYAGRLCEAGADLPVVIREVGELLAEKCGHEALGELMDDCIANLPEVDLA